MQLSTLLSFLPTILNLLLSLLAKCGSVGSVGIDTMRLLLHVVTQTKEAKRHDALVAYVKVLVLLIFFLKKLILIFTVCIWRR